MVLWLINTLAGAILVLIYIRSLDREPENEAWHWFEENQKRNNKRD